MRKLVIQIPCYNEEETLPVALASLPRKLPEFEVVEWLVIDDGSQDRTVAVAKAHGVDHVVRLPRHQGLSRAFMAGLEASLKAGADVIVNTDADNQYNADDIPKLIAPILAGEAEMTVGARPIADIRHFSPVKKILQRVGSWVTRLASNTEVDDAPCGFRAVTREAAMKLKVYTDYTYTIETIIQAGQKGMAITSVPISTNESLRSSRLVQSMFGYMNRQMLTMVRIFMTYRPFRFFAVPGAMFFAAGFLIGVRFVYLFVTVGGGGHIQSLILAALLLGLGFFMVIVGLVADLISVNRKLLEGLDWRLQKMEDHMHGRPGEPGRA